MIIYLVTKMVGPIYHIDEKVVAALVIDELIAIVEGGIKLPDGWQERPMTLEYIDYLLDIAMQQIEAKPPRSP